MKGIWKSVISVALVFAGCAFCGSQAVPADGLPQSALVVVATRYFTGTRAGNGFVVGDGTLVVTCDHLVNEASKTGAHRCEGFVSVFSPCLGQACDARILASDEGADLAVLEVPWKGHPALSLASADAILDANSVRVIGLSRVIDRLEDWDSVNSPERFEAQGEVLPVAYVGVRGRLPRLIALNKAEAVGSGWSGSAIVLPDTGEVVGCITTVQRNFERFLGQGATGPTVSQALGLLGDGFDKGRLRRTEPCLESPADAGEACSLALRTSSLQRPQKYEMAMESARAFIRLRPDLGYGHRMLAYAAERAGQPDVASESYRRAMELDPNSLSTQLVYAQFLSGNGKPDEAKQILEPLWRAGRSRGLVAIGLANLLDAQKEFSRCTEILAEATRSESRNANLWQMLAACRAQTQGPAAAIDPLNRAVELRPEEGRPRGMLARILEMTGNLDEAEKHFRTLLDVESTNPVVYCWLADFLSKHRPEAMQEALRLAEKALDLPPHPSLPREKVEQLTAAIRSRVGVSPQN
ncbi:MAG TPA: tetratricopeptide repeat protein [Sedimentisphaerales bacterium]|jgi:Flp pilus assembly protein TadD|nr:tetratricopeptide repeat protein [Sedimentisphaerales bacterium]HNU28602.1 tetratricopeptide repeat protein [Sedimentisphaerales bacterium]